MTGKYIVKIYLLSGRLKKINYLRTLHFSNLYKKYIYDLRKLELDPDYFI